MSIKLSSPAFEDGGMIPGKYTCDGDDVSPHLNWENIPDGTQSIAIIMIQMPRVAPGGAGRSYQRIACRLSL